jgi:hypothetical protein
VEESDCKAFVQAGYKVRMKNVAVRGKSTPAGEKASADSKSVLKFNEQFQSLQKNSGFF